MTIQFATQLAAADASKLPAVFAALFAQAGIEAPKNGEKVSLAKIDATIKDLDIDERMIIKSALWRAGLI